MLRYTHFVVGVVGVAAAGGGVVVVVVVVVVREKKRRQKRIGTRAKGLDLYPLAQEERKEGKSRGDNQGKKGRTKRRKE